MALLALAVAAGCSVTAFHVDHELRPGSSAEAAVVARAAARLGARFVACRAPVRPGPNLEARARAARFAVLPEGVATGHTMDDQAETVLANLLRGAASAGLAGMRRGPTHPILGLRRCETEAVCADLGLEVVADPSNDDLAFVRNRLRHEVLPLLCQVARRDVVPVLARQAEVLAEESDALDRLAAEALPDPADSRALALAPRALARRAVRAWLRARGSLEETAGTRRRAPYPPSLAEVDAVLDVARGGARAVQLSGGLTVRRSKRRLGVASTRSTRS